MININYETVSEVRVDYLKVVFTLPKVTMQTIENDKTLEYIINLLGYSIYNITKKENYGRYGYKQTIQLGEYINIYLFGAKNKENKDTFLLEMKGEACSEYNDKGYEWKYLLDFCFNQGYKFTRIDIAVDVIDDNYINIDNLFNKVTLREFYTPVFRKCELYDSFNISDNYTLGKTITYGSRTSEMMLVIYDKKAERKVRNSNALIFAKSWTRIETRFQKGKADNFITEWRSINYENLGVLISQILNYTIKFTEPSKNKVDNTYKYFNQRDWRPCEWWNNFINTTKKLKIKPTQSLEKTIVKNKGWLEASASRVLSRVLVAKPNDFIDFLFYLLDKGKDTLDNSDLVSINNYRTELKLDPISFNDMYESLNEFKDTIIKL